MSLTILHAGWHLERLWLWGEKTASEVSSPPAGKSAEHLAEALSSVALRRELAVMGLVGSQSAQLKIWLPTQSGRAVLNTGLTENAGKRPAKTTLAGWPVAAAGVELKVAADLLSVCLAQEVLAPGLVAGPDLLYWAQAWRFAGALTARQQFLPSLAWAGKSARAVWRPFFPGPEMRRLVKLAQLMPPVCRALNDTKAAQAPDLAAKAVLQAFLDEAVDYLARPAPEAPAALTTAKGKKAKTVLLSRPAFDSLHDQWLYALRAADGKLVADAAELRQLDDALHEWQLPLTALAATPFRLSFRLEEPSDPEAAPVTGKRKKVTRGPDEWYLGYHLQAVDEQSQLAVVNRLAAANNLPDAIITASSGLKITPLDAAVPEAAQALIDQLALLLPHVKITELLLEVDEWTGFTRHFTHLKSGDTAQDKTLLLTAILADGINLGLTKMAESCPGTTYAKLSWLQAWHIRDETYATALAELVNAQFRQPFAKHWGEVKLYVKKSDLGTTTKPETQRHGRRICPTTGTARNARTAFRRAVRPLAGGGSHRAGKP